MNKKQRYEALCALRNVSYELVVHGYTKERKGRLVRATYILGGKTKALIDTCIVNNRFELALFLAIAPQLHHLIEQEINNLL